MTLVFSVAVAATAQNNGKGPAFTEIPTGDPSFALVGEFVGSLGSDQETPDMLALQIRCVGGTDFEAVSFRGGLPGRPEHLPQTLKMIGRRNGKTLILSGGPWAIFVHRDHCLIVDQEGQLLGRLERVIRQSPTLGAAPPQDAVVIFDGSDVEQFMSAEMTEDGLLKEGAQIKPMFQDFNLHAEFRIPYMPEALGQNRGNSGIYLQGRYECQVLDSFAADRLVNGLGAIYQQKKPDINMALPPLVWQTYDIQFTAPRWAADGSKLRDAQATVWVNGVKVHDNVALTSKTGHGQPEEPRLLPTMIQDHGDPVRFRNVWIVDRGLMLGDFPVVAGAPSATPAEESAVKEPTAVESAAEASAEEESTLTSASDGFGNASDADAPTSSAAPTDQLPVDGPTATEDASAADAAVPR